MKYFNLNKPRKKIQTKKILCFRVFVFSCFFVLVFSCFFIFTSGVFAESGNYGLDDTTGQATTLKTDTDIPAKIGTIIGAGLSFIGILFFILIIYGGFLWMTARGNEEQVKKAIELVTQACIGLAIVAAAYLITKFIGEAVLSSFTG